jgi:phytanoyl-CoA hydroxylase
MFQLNGFFKRSKKWRLAPEDLPWFDQPNAFEILEKRRQAERFSDQDYELLRQWVTDGFCTVSGVVDQKHIQAMILDMDQLWTAEKAIEGLQILDLKLSSDGPLVNLSHAELLALEPATRKAIQLASRWRIHGFYLFSPAGGQIFNNPELIRLTSLILNKKAAPSFTINFTYGSEQSLHQDTAVFHVSPANYLIGAWLACEDIAPDSGPLVYYPGSHREKLFSDFNNYPQTNLRTAKNPQEYTDYVARQSEKYERKLYVAKKGDIFLWHGMLIHGGSPVTNPNQSRRSYVCHYIPPEMEVSSQIVGPFNW